MKNVHRGVLSAALVAGFSFTSLVQAASINVLWYTYADPASEYREKISQLSSMVHTLPQSNGSSWNLNYWDAGSAAPEFTAFDVLVIESGEAFRTGAPGGPLATPNYSGILDNKAAIEAARGDRTFITAADSDFHAIRGDTGNIPDSEGGGRCAPALTSSDCWDGALGHSVNAVNWAGSGNGLGVVSFLDGEHAGSFWWTNVNSFLHSELDGRVGYGGSEQNPVINPLQAAHPLNSGLTSKGLSDWDNSFHAFLLPVDGYTSIVDSSLR
ncbi:MAG: PEP-CTERM sorting domain-containing protein, partial [Nitrosospira sp.]